MEAGQTHFYWLAHSQQFERCFDMLLAEVGLATMETNIEDPDDYLVKLICNGDIIDQIPYKTLVPFAAYAKTTLKSKPELDLENSDLASVIEILNLIKESKDPLVLFPKGTFSANLLLYEAAMMLSLPFESVSQVEFQLQLELKTRLITIEELKMVIERISPIDNVFIGAAENLAYHRRIGKVPDLVDYMCVIDKRWMFRAKMASFDAAARDWIEDQVRSLKRMRSTV